MKSLSPEHVLDWKIEDMEQTRIWTGQLWQHQFLCGTRSGYN